MREIGLVEVHTVVHARSWRGGSAGCRLPVVVSTEIRDRLVEAGMSGSDIEAMHRLLTDPKTVILGNLTYSTVGRAPR
jgi:hypothetical protein